MYALRDISLFFGSHHLLDKISFLLNHGDKVALIGRNGVGKTTLFKIIIGDLSADSGEVVLPKNCKIGYLSQHFNLDESKGIMATCLECFSEYFDVEKALHDKHEELSNSKDDTKAAALLNEIDDLQVKLNSLEVNNPHADASKILKGFGFVEEQFDKPINTLSGGWKMRVQMSKLLLSKPDLLLLDEPDNHLDIEALIWFEKYLQSYPKAILFISHDIQFMSNVANNIYELSNKKLFTFKGKYHKYLESKAVRQEKEQQAYTNQQKIIKEKERTITRFMAKESKTKMAQSMLKQLNKMERIEIESEDITQMNIVFPVTGSSGKVVVKVANASKSYGAKKVLEGVDLEILKGQKVAFVGQNGQGKSTLVKMIAGDVEYNSGSVDLGHNVILNYFSQDQSEVLDEKLTALETIESLCDPDYYTSCRKTLGAFSFSGDDVHKKVSVLSGGEKSRLAMACLVSQKSNFLILDEPTNHLDIHSKAILKKAIIEYPGTLIIVSHDRDILKGSVDITYEFRDRKVIEHLGDLEYVLQKRASEDIRDFQAVQKDSKNTEATKSPDSKLSYEEQKKINRGISNAEKKIDKFEKEIAVINEKLMDAGYYNSDKGTQDLKSLKDLQSALEKANEDWDKWVNKLEES